MGLAEKYTMQQISDEVEAVVDRVPDQLRETVSGAMLAVAGVLLEDLRSRPTLAAAWLTLAVDMATCPGKSAVIACRMLQALGLPPECVGRLHELTAEKGEIPAPDLTKPKLRL